MENYHRLTQQAEQHRQEVEQIANQSRLANSVTPKDESSQPIKRVMSAAGDLLINAGQRIKRASDTEQKPDVVHNGVRDTQSMPAV